MMKMAHLRFGFSAGVSVVVVVGVVGPRSWLRLLAGVDGIVPGVAVDTPVPVDVAGATVVPEAVLPEELPPRILAREVFVSAANADVVATVATIAIILRIDLFICE